MLFDTVLGTRESLQEIVATDPRGRHTTGRALRLPGYGHTRGDGLSERDERLFAVDLAGGRLVPLVVEPVAVAENGCARVEPAASGAWTLQCPPARALRLDGE